ncbi:MAG: Spx/MgsR family RNA polymerase-binding regulatory protein [Cyanobium sp.]
MLSRPRIYSYPACGTCRRALKWLRESGIDVELVDITGQPPSLAELRVALAQLGRKRLFNTSGQSYRALGGAVVQAFSDDEALAALAADGRLIKRPVLVMPDGTTLTGFQPREWEALLRPQP